LILAVFKSKITARLSTKKYRGRGKEYFAETVDWPLFCDIIGI
jgi:hypothetical protein